MIKNVPVSLNQKDMLILINESYYNKYNYFYLPMDLRTKQNVGFAFINLVDSLFVPDFFLDFNCLQWNEILPHCLSKKVSKIVYANVQGLEQIKQEMANKTIMQKNDARIKPIWREKNIADPRDLQEILSRYKDPDYLREVRHKLWQFSNLNN